MRGLFMTVAGISLSVGVIAALLLAVSPLVGRRYAAKWRYWVWIVLAVRLIIPFSFSVSLQKPEPDVSASEDVGKLEEAAHDAAAPQIRRWVIMLPPQVAEPIAEPEPIQEQSASVAEPAKKRLNVTPLGIISGIWVVGVAAYLIVHTVSYAGFRTGLSRHGKDLKGGEEAKIYSRVRDELNIRRRIPVYRYASAPSPMLMGYFRPALVLPEEEYDPEQLYYIFKHELMHYKRRDVWFKLLFVLANALHWFNPIVWAIGRQAVVDMELSCDDGVVRGEDFDAKKAYAETLFSTLSRRKTLGTALSTQFFGGKKVMKKRFKNILGMVNKRNGALILALVIILTSVLGTAVGCSVAERNTTDDQQVSDASDDKLDDTDSQTDEPESITHPVVDPADDLTEWSAYEFLEEIYEKHKILDGVLNTGETRYTGDFIEVDGRIYSEMDEIKSMERLKMILKEVYATEKANEILEEKSDIFLEQNGRFYRAWDAPVLTTEIIYTPEPYRHERYEYENGNFIVLYTPTADGNGTAAVTLKEESKDEGTYGIVSIERIGGDPIISEATDILQDLRPALISVNREIFTAFTSYVPDADIIIDGETYMKMVNLTSLDDVMELLRSVFTEETAKHYYDMFSSYFLEREDGLYRIDGYMQGLVYELPVFSANREGDDEIFVYTESAQHEEYYCFIDLKRENGEWRIADYDYLEYDIFKYPEIPDIPDDGVSSVSELNSKGDTVILGATYIDDTNIVFLVLSGARTDNANHPGIIFANEANICLSTDMGMRSYAFYPLDVINAGSDREGFQFYRSSLSYMFDPFELGSGEDSQRLLAFRYYDDLYKDSGDMFSDPGPTEGGAYLAPWFDVPEFEDTGKTLFFALNEYEDGSGLLEIRPLAGDFSGVGSELRGDENGIVAVTSYNLRTHLDNSIRDQATDAIFTFDLDSIKENRPDEPKYTVTVFGS